MGWSRYKSKIEVLAVEAILEFNGIASIDAIVEYIKIKDASILNSKTPKNSVYGVIYKREKRRKAIGAEKLFQSRLIDEHIYFSLSANYREIDIGNKIVSNK